MTILCDRYLGCKSFLLERKSHLFRLDSISESGLFSCRRTRLVHSSGQLAIFRQLTFGAVLHLSEFLCKIDHFSSADCRIICNREGTEGAARQSRRTELPEFGIKVC